MKEAGLDAEIPQSCSVSLNSQAIQLSEISVICDFQKSRKLETVHAAFQLIEKYFCPK